MIDVEGLRESIDKIRALRPKLYVGKPVEQDTVGTYPNGFADGFNDAVEQVDVILASLLQGDQFALDGGPDKMMQPKMPGPIMELREDGSGPVVERLRVVGSMGKAKLRDVPKGALAYFVDHPEADGWYEADWEKGRDSDDEEVWFVPCQKEPLDSKVTVEANPKEGA